MTEQFVTTSCIIPSGLRTCEVIDKGCPLALDLGRLQVESWLAWAVDRESKPSGSLVSMLDKAYRLNDFAW